MNGDNKKQEQQEYLKAFNNYFPRWDRESGCIKKIKEDLERIEKITDLEEKLKEVNFAWTKHNWNEKHVSGLYNAGDLHELVSHKDTIEKYRKLVKELWDLNIKLIKQKQQSNNNNSDRHSKQQERERERESSSSSNQSVNNSESKEDYDYCSNCVKKIYSSQEYYYNSAKNDNKKFCSEKCYLEYYGEYCLTCKPDQKYLDIYKLNETDPCGYCWNCYQEQLRKLAELEKEGKEIEERIAKQKKEQEEWEKTQNNKNNNLNPENEQNRTEQNRKPANLSEEVDPSSLNSQINNLQKEITQLENSNNPQQQNLLKEKREELREMEKQLNIQNTERLEKPNNSKLILGLGMGVLGLGLIGMVVWLFVRRKGVKE